MIDRAELLRLKEAAEAYPFVEESWEYTRDHKIKSIRYEGEPHWPVRRNIRRALRYIFPWTKRPWQKSFESYRWWKPNFTMAWFALTHLNDNRPDGSLRNSIITHWEEDGEFIENFPPSKVKELIELAELGLEVAEDRILAAVRERIGEEDPA